MTLDEALEYCNKIECSNCVVKLFNLDIRNKDDILCYENLVNIYNIDNKRLKKKLRRKRDEFSKNRKDS